MIPLSLTAALVVILAAPHLIPRTRLPPVVGISMWLSVLGLRSLLTIVAAVSLVLVLPSSTGFQLLTGWCLHAVVPYLTTHLGLSGHAAGDLALLLPAIAIALSLAAATLGAWRSARSVRFWIRRNSLGRGPADSLIVGDQGMILATAGIRQPQVVVSARTLLTLDVDELAAGIQHECGHVRHGHRFITLLSVGLLGSSRLLPRGRSAFDELHFQLERDADEYAVRMTGDPLALAGAICKVASNSLAKPAIALAGLGGSDALDRLHVLLADGRTGSNDRFRFIGAVVAALAGIATLFLVAALPGLATAGMSEMHVSLGAAGFCS